MTQVTIGRWGKSLAVRLPSELVERFRLAEGQRVDLATGEDVVTLRFRPTLADLFAGRTAEQWRAIYREAGEALDWGPDVGREEIVE